MFTQKIRTHLKWIIPLGILVVFGLALANQSVEVVSATITPEVVVKGQDQEVRVTAVIKQKGLLPPVVFVSLTEPEKPEDYNIFRGKTKILGLLHKKGGDNSGSSIYEGRFTINHSRAETVQIRLKNAAMRNIYPTEIKDQASVFKNVTPTLRLAVSTRFFALPPDPGEAGKATLEGIDVDNDGLRDDIQREIFFAFPESERVRTVTSMGLKATQRQMINREQQEVIDSEEFNIFKNIECVSYFLKFEFRKYVTVSENLTFLLENTVPRMMSYSDVQRKLSKSSYETSLKGAESCDFDWQSLPD